MHQHLSLLGETFVRNSSFQIEWFVKAEGHKNNEKDETSLTIRKNNCDHSYYHTNQQGHKECHQVVTNITT